MLAFPINISRLHNLQSAITDGNSLRRKVARSFSSTFLFPAKLSARIVDIPPGWGNLKFFSTEYKLGGNIL